MSPQEGVGGCTPSPRKDSAASTRMAFAMKSVEYTITVGSTLRSTWRVSTCSAVAPSARAALTYSVSRATSTAPRTTRITVGAPQMPTASVVLTTPGPSADTTAIARRRYGKASSTSVARITSASVHPPRNPARQPSVSPSDSATATDSTLTISATRLP